jgi:iron complex transport system permease protein
VQRASIVLVGLAVLSLSMFALSLFAGAASLGDSSLRNVLLELRFSRAAVAYLAGASLAVGGVLAQGLFRNPLASPDVLGTSAGASFVGKLCLLFFQWLLARSTLAGLSPELFLPLGCLIGALGTLLVLLAIARTQPETVVLLLVGFLLSSFFLSLGSFVTSLAQESWEVGRAVVAFALGGVSSAGPRQVAWILPIAVIGTCAAYAWSRPLDLMLSGEEEASMLGLDIARTRRWCIAWTALLTAGAVAVGGNVGFVGLVVPHGLRGILGASHRTLVPGAALGGGAFLLACDLVTRLIPSQSEVPLGVVTGLIGAPTFLWLLLKTRRESQYG